MSDQKHLAFAVASWLSSQAASSPSPEKLQEASKNVCHAFGLNLEDSTQKATYGGGPGLNNVWDVFVKTQAKMGGGAAPAPKASGSAKEISPEDKAKAEALKGDGNKAMSAKDYGAAIDAYTQAISIHSQNPVYFSNRSAAYAQVGQHDKAIEDAKEASKIDPNFAKAYSRLGHALFSSRRYEEAVEAYSKGVEVDPNNALMKSGLETARQHVKDSAKPTSPTPSNRDVSSPGAGADAGGLPGMGGGGGMPDLSALMNNPMIAQMAQSMMANGGLEQMMNNPMLQQMMSRFGGGGAGGGGMPDINAMMQDPQMREMARSFMGGAGGAGAGGAGAGAGRGGGAGGRGSGGSTGDDMFS